MIYLSVLSAWMTLWSFPTRWLIINYTSNVCFTSAASTASPSTSRSVFLVPSRLNILVTPFPAPYFLLTTSMSPPSLLFCPFTNHPALQQFLGMVNFYRKFICGAALIFQPLTNTLCGDPKDFSWSTQMDSTFISAKSALALVPTLVHPETFYMCFSDSGCF